ncbi:hypothetical protein CVT24_002304 [Panaeolus cyanescens]|uniref:10 kDa heat shock protein, mitochondrial n=1 Tax=Panaeolus cyanescens TaxID=181874 RepID=A0A409YIQ6_9AGAR|nr:hypothetical protein CVT24_002304 [Panaeolus cyanescens]
MACGNLNLHAYPAHHITCLPPRPELQPPQPELQPPRPTPLTSIKSVVPLFDRVLVQRFKPETKTATGIFLPTSATSNPLPEATVIAVGPGAPNKDGKFIQPAVKAGDRVLLPSWGGSTIKVGEEEYCLFKDSEILAKIKD